MADPLSPDVSSTRPTTTTSPHGPAPAERPDYGLDAPGAVRNLFAVAAAGLVAWLGAVVGLWPPSPRGIPFAGTGFLCFLSFGFTGAYMVWGSKVGKVRKRERLLDALRLRGDETVLDVGCGRGLMLVAAAKRLTPGCTGRAHGIDIWQTEDLSGNGMVATLENARREGVADRVAVQTADMRELPFEGGTFDAVVTTFAIHNLYQRPDRDKAIAEIARVLKPGGAALIADMRHHGQYARAFRDLGFTDVRRVGSPVTQRLWALLTWGAFQPATLLARKPAS
jgi:ubiquinone/menaquinone biosynthesis C-methylase UbiE